MCSPPPGTRFISHGYERASSQDLYSVCNVVSPLHRKKIMMAINNLRADYLGA